MTRYEKLYKLIDRLEEDSNRLLIPLIGKDDGALLASLVFNICSYYDKRDKIPQIILLDAGAGIGYSTAWIALGAAPFGRKCWLVAIEYEEDLFRLLKENLMKISEYVENTIQAEALLGDALHHMGKLPPYVGLGFVDIEKYQYTKALELLLPKTLPNGVLAFHNALFPSPPSSFFRSVEKTGYPSLIIPTSRGGMLLLAKKPGAVQP